MPEIDNEIDNELAELDEMPQGEFNMRLLYAALQSWVEDRYRWRMWSIEPPPPDAWVLAYHSQYKVQMIHPSHHTPDFRYWRYLDPPPTKGFELHEGQVIPDMRTLWKSVDKISSARVTEHMPPQKIYTGEGLGVPHEEAQQEYQQMLRDAQPVLLEKEVEHEELDEEE